MASAHSQSESILSPFTWQLNRVHRLTKQNKPHPISLSSWPCLCSPPNALLSSLAYHFPFIPFLFYPLSLSVSSVLLFKMWVRCHACIISNFGSLIDRAVNPEQHLLKQVGSEFTTFFYSIDVSASSHKCALRQTGTVKALLSVGS